MRGFPIPATELRRSSLPTLRGVGRRAALRATAACVIGAAFAIANAQAESDEERKRREEQERRRKEEESKRQPPRYRHQPDAPGSPPRPSPPGGPPGDDKPQRDRPRIEPE